MLDLELRRNVIMMTREMVRNAKRLGSLTLVTCVSFSDYFNFSPQWVDSYQGRMSSNSAQSCDYCYGGSVSSDTNHLEVGTYNSTCHNSSARPDVVADDSSLEMSPTRVPMDVSSGQQRNLYTVQ